MNLDWDFPLVTRDHTSEFVCGSAAASCMVILQNYTSCTSHLQKSVYKDSQIKHSGQQMALNLKIGWKKPIF